MKADPSLQNCTKVDPFGIAIMRGRREMFDLFVNDVKVQLDQKDSFGRTPLLTAARYGCVVSCFLKLFSFFFFFFCVFRLIIVLRC